MKNLVIIGVLMLLQITLLRGLPTTRRMISKEFRMITSTRRPTTTTTNYPTTKPYGCYDKGKYYYPGEEMENGYHQQSNWCYGTFCSDYGSIIHWDNWNCKTTPTTPPTTTSTDPITLPETSTPPDPTTLPTTIIPTSFAIDSCYVDGKFHPRGSKIDSGDDGKGWCYGRYCDHYGKVIHWDDWNCGPTTYPDTTAPDPTTMYPTTRDKTTEPARPCRHGGHGPLKSTAEPTTIRETTAPFKPTTIPQTTARPATTKIAI